MSLENLSKELKRLVATYDAKWFLGDLSSLIQSIASGNANDQLGKLSSPLRQIYFLAGLLVTSDHTNGKDIMFTHEKWGQIVDLLNKIEEEYDKLFLPKFDEKIDEEWKRVRKVAVPSFLSYFNQGPLNYEEQTVNWVIDLYSPLDMLIEESLGLKTDEFIRFYNNLDMLFKANFQSHTLQKDHPLRKNWETYTQIKMGVREGVPDFIKDAMEPSRPLHTFVSDRGIINRFYPEELVSDTLPIEKVKNILELLTISQKESDFLYYTSTRPGNPLFDKPIIDIGRGMFQVFEVRQLMYSIENLLEITCSSTQESLAKLTAKKGKLLEKKVLDVFKLFLKDDLKVHVGYYVDRCEQDILLLWKGYAFIIETKGYNLREPFRDPNKAFARISNDFNSCIGYGYTQAKRIEKYFLDGLPLKITDKNGTLIEEIDTKEYADNAFSIIVNLKSFGQVQNDLSNLLHIDDGHSYPWAVKVDDLEVFLLTLIAQKKKPSLFIDYLKIRESLHGRLLCSDELELCGAFFTGKINTGIIGTEDLVVTNPDLTSIFDIQYKKVMGFKNEKLLKEKTSGRYLLL